MVSSLNSTIDEQKPSTQNQRWCFHFNMCLWVLVLTYIDTKQMKAIFLQVPWKFTNTLLNQTLPKVICTLAYTWGINLFGADPRYQKNEHRPPVHSACVQSVLISHITLANNSSILPMLRLCYMTSDWWHLMESWQKTLASCTCGNWKVAPAAPTEGRTLRNPLLVIHITMAELPFPLLL